MIRRIRRRTAHVLTILAASFAVLGLVAVGVGTSNSRFLDKINRAIGPAEMAPFDRVLRTFERCSKWEYFDAKRLASPVQQWLGRLEHASLLHVSARTALTGGVDQAGPCGATSRSLIVLLRRAGVPARKAILYAPNESAVHTVVEVSIDGEWRVFDPTYAWYWVRPRDGAIATAEDLAHDPALFARVLEQHPNYPIDEYRYDRVHHLRWDKVPGLEAVRRWLERTGRGEFARNLQTPGLYERPAYLSACIFAVLGGLLFLGAKLASHGLGRVPQPPSRDWAAGRRAVS
jgi:hypothetical protein